MVAWMSGSGGWQSMTVDETGWLADGLAKGGPAAKASRVRLAAHVLEKSLATPESVRTGNGEQWARIAGSLAPDMDAATRVKWVERLRTAFAEPKTLGSLNRNDVTTLADGLAALGDKDAYGFVAAWMKASPAWESLPPGEWTSLAGAWRRAVRRPRPRLRIIDEVTKKHLGSADGTRTISCGDWGRLVVSLKGDLGAGTLRDWAGKLRGAFLDAKTLGGLGLPDLKDLAGTLDQLGDRDSQGVFVAWMSAGPAWESLEPAGLVDLASAIDKIGDNAKQERLRLADHFARKYLAKRRPRGR